MDAVILPPQGPAISGERAIRAWHEGIFKDEISRIDSKVDEVQVFGDWGFASGTTSGTIQEPRHATTLRQRSRGLPSVSQSQQAQNGISCGVARAVRGERRGDARKCLTILQLMVSPDGIEP